MKKQQSNDYNRRDFLKGTSIATMMAMMGGVELRAEDAPATNTAPALTVIPVGPTVKFGIIGLGPWGREMITELGKLPNAPVVAICDTYAAYLNRSGDAAPKAEKYEDYTKLLENKEVQAVVVATPTHQHKEIVLAALKAGKHVYCEAPLACSIEDAKEIAQAAKASVKQVFQSGLQVRCHPQRIFLLPYIRSGATGKNVTARAQWHKKQSWVRNSPNPDRFEEINWRLHSKTSTGLIGEVGIHQIDSVCGWFYHTRPTAVTGFSSMIAWGEDKRDVPDTVQAVFELPEGANFIFDATLANSFDSQYEVYNGTFATVMIRGNGAWMFKEVDSPLLGWEVYVRKQTFFGESGLSLVAGATKQSSKGAKASEDNPYPNSDLYYALEAFTANVGKIGQAVTDYVDSFGDSDLQALQAQLATLKTAVAPGWKEGFEATVLAIKANEAVLKKERIVLKDEWFEV